MRWLICIAALCLLATAACAQGVNWSPELGGDIVYRFGADTISVGAGLQLATFWDGLCELRGELLADLGTDNFCVGVGIGVRVPKLIQKLGGDWAAKAFVPTVGVLGLWQPAGKPEFAAGAYLSVLRVEF